MSTSKVNPVFSADKIRGEPPPEKPIDIFREREGQTFNAQEFYASIKPHKPTAAQIALIETLRQVKNRIFLLIGGPGTGKTFCVSVICKRLALVKSKVLYVGTSQSVTDVAAVMIAEQVGVDKVVRYGKIRNEEKIVAPVKPLTLDSTMTRTAEAESHHALDDKQKVTVGASGDLQVVFADTNQLRHQCLRDADVLVTTVGESTSQEILDVFKPRVIIIEDAGQALPEHLEPLFRAFSSTAQLFIEVGDVENGYITPESEANLEAEDEGME